MPTQIEMTDLSATTTVSDSDYFWLKRGVADFRVTLANLFGWHTGDIANPHGTTKAQVGLGNVLNAEQLTKSLNLSDITSPLTARTNLSVMSIAEVTAAILAHSNLTNNPHNVDKIQVGLGNLSNYIISDSYTSGSPTTYASSKALKGGLDSIIASIVSPIKGEVAMWYGNGALFSKSGWAICDGTLNEDWGGLLPDMRDTFPKGVPIATAAAGTIGGSHSNIHNHATTVTGHALTEAQMPSHTHPMKFSLKYSGSGNGREANQPGWEGRQDNTQYTETTGSGEAHTHGTTNPTSGSTTGNQPKFMELHFIIKVV